MSATSAVGPAERALINAALEDLQDKLQASCGREIVIAMVVAPAARTYAQRNALGEVVISVISSCHESDLARLLREAADGIHKETAA